MSADKQRGKALPQRPLMPRLAASTPNAKASSPAPKLAPHLAAAHKSSPKLATLGRPLATSAAPSPPVGEIGTQKSTPIRNLVEANVTPRSSSRQARADSTQSTPNSNTNGTPTRNGSRPAVSPSLSFAGRVAGARQDFIPGERSESDLNRLRDFGGSPYGVAPDTPSDVSHNPNPGLWRRSQENDPHFVGTNNVPHQEPVIKRPSHKKTTSFVYANGAEELSDEASPNGLKNVPTSQWNGPPRKSEAENGSPLHSPFFPISESEHGLGGLSPPRQGVSPSHRKGTSQVVSANGYRSAPVKPQPDSYHGRSQPQRQPSLTNKIDPRCRKASSVSSQDSSAAKAKVPTPILPHFPFPSVRDSPLVSPTLSASEKVIGHGNTFEQLENCIDRVQSPVSTTGSGDGSQVNDSVANARRERKLLDLEISNSSLLAINRSLEKEVLRQKSEVRRLRRMSRNTQRYSSLSTAASDLSQSQMSELSEDDDEDVNDEHTGDYLHHFESSDGDSQDEDHMSPGALAQRDARHRKSDQRRLQLDLAKHKELLADSTKMNQSLKKCLGVTEQLIKDGNRALEYKVDTAEVRLGGRVLTDLNDTEDESMLRTDSLVDEEDSFFKSGDVSQKPAGREQDGERPTLEDVNDLAEARP